MEYIKPKWDLNVHKECKECKVRIQNWLQAEIIKPVTKRKKKH